MPLSDEQMNIVSGHRIAAWEPVEMPVGRQQLPSWLRGANVDWMDGCGNAPEVKLLVRDDPYEWPGQVWVKEGNDAYITRHEDGRCKVHYHGGQVMESAAWRIYAGDRPFTYKWDVPKALWAGESPLDAARREGEAHLQSCQSLDDDFESPFGVHGVKIRRSELRLVVKPMRITEEQGGYGGRGYLLQMADGSETLLRGPWHGGAPAGYVETHTYQPSEKIARWERNRPWFKRGGNYGLYITEELFLAAIATYAPHVRIARVQHSYGWRLEPYRQEWGMPKAMVYDLEHGRAIRNEPAGEFWRVYWDGSERYCGSLRIPTYGYQPGVDGPTS